MHLPQRPHVLATGLALAALLAAGVARAEDARLVILHTTDLHGAFDDWDYARDRPAGRGLTRIGTLVRRARAEGNATLLLDAGDAIQGGAGSLFARPMRRRPHPVIAAMNALGYEAMAVGNHEFDFGSGARERLRREANFPWLAANVVRADGGPVFDATRVVTLQGIKVGVVGVCTPGTPAFMDSSLWAGLRFLDPLEPASREVQRLRRVEHCDVVLLLAHTGLERDPARPGFAGPGCAGCPPAERTGDTPGENWAYRLAEQVRGVDAVIMGHTHAQVPFARVGGTLVTQAGHHGESLGRIEIALSRADPRSAWVTGSIRGHLIAVSDTVAEDSVLAALMRPYRDEARAALSAEVGVAERAIDAPAGRAADGEMWRLIHRAQLAASGADVSLAALPEPSATIPAGAVRERDLLRLYPYENTLVVASLSGDQLRQVLEHSAGMLNAYDFSHDRPLFAAGASTFNFDMAAGVEYRIDLTRPAGSRVTDLRFRGAPLDPARVLKVAANSYRAFGGGGFPAIAAAPKLRPTPLTVRDLIAEYLRAPPAAGPQGAPGEAGSGGWSLSPAHVGAPERAHIDRLVRTNVLSREEAIALDPAAPVSRRAFLGWLSRAMGPRGGHHPAKPGPADPSISLAAALEACERAARAARYVLAARSPDAAYRRSLLTGTSLAPLARARALPDRPSITSAQALGLIANLRFPAIRVLETTDFHGAILQTGRDRATDRAVGGSAVLAAWVEKLRAENPEGTVLLDGGDWYQGTMISNLQFGRPVIQQMNALGYAAAAIGNHEFDWNADTLQRRVAELEFAALGANMVERKTGRMPRWVRADTVFARRGMKVGVMGLCYRNTPVVTLGKYVAHLRFDDDSATAARLAPALDRRSDVMIAVGHVPAEVDTSRRARGDLPRIARIPGFDLVMGGHSHNQVIDRIGDVPVMISGSHGGTVGVCDLVMDGLTRKVIERYPRLQSTFHGEVQPDSAMLARITAWNANVAPIAGQFLCRNARRLGRVRGGESSLGSLVADAMRAEVQADVAMQNSGGLRADLAEGDVTRGAIYEVMPFDNTLVTVVLSGTELRRTFEEGLAYGRIPQVSGVRLVFDMGRPSGQRLVSLELDGGRPVEPGKDYRVVVNNFMAGGGDNYETFPKARELQDTAINVRDALERYVLALARAGGGTLDYRSDGRIRREGPPSGDISR